MRLLERYIRRQIITGTVTAMAVILTLLAFLSLVEELDDVGRGQYRIIDAFYYVGMVLPQYAYQIFPVTALLGSLIGLGQLANHSELTAMRSAGVSMAHLVRMVLRTGLYMLIVALLVGEVIAPVAEQGAKQMRAAAISEQITLKTRYGFWARDGEAFVNIRNILPGGHLEDISIYELDKDKKLVSVTHASSAQYKEGGWLLKDIQKTDFIGESEGTHSEHMQRANWTSLLDPELLSVVLSKPQALPAWGLYNYIQFMKDNGQDASAYEVAFWAKIVTPVITLIMLFLSVPFVFGSLRAIGIGQRVFAGTIIGMGFLLLNQAVGQMAIVYHVNPLLAVSFPAVLFLGAAMWFFRRVY